MNFKTPNKQTFFTMETFISYFPNHHFIDTQTDTIYTAKQVPHSYTGKTLYLMEGPKDRIHQTGLLHSQITKPMKIAY